MSYSLWPIGEPTWLAHWNGMGLDRVRIYKHWAWNSWKICIECSNPTTKNIYIAHRTMILNHRFRWRSFASYWNQRNYGTPFKSQRVLAATIWTMRRQPKVPYLKGIATRVVVLAANRLPLFHKFTQTYYAMGLLFLSTCPSSTWSFLKGIEYLKYVVFALIRSRPLLELTTYLLGSYWEFHRWTYSSSR